MLHARNSDPETSHESQARQSPKRLTEATAYVVALLQCSGPMADFEIAEAFDAGWNRPHHVSLHQAARNMARNLGKVRATAERRLNPISGHRQIVWEAADDQPPTVPCCPACGALLRREEQRSRVAAYLSEDI